MNKNNDEQWTWYTDEQKSCWTVNIMKWRTKISIQVNMMNRWTKPRKQMNMMNIWQMNKTAMNSEHGEQINKNHVGQLNMMNQWIKTTMNIEHDEEMNKNLRYKWTRWTDEQNNDEQMNMMNKRRKIHFRTWWNNEQNTIGSNKEVSTLFIYLFIFSVHDRQCFQTCVSSFSSHDNYFNFFNFRECILLHVNSTAFDLYAQWPARFFVTLSCLPTSKLWNSLADVVFRPSITILSTLLIQEFTSVFITFHPFHW